MRSHCFSLLLAGCSAMLAADVARVCAQTAVPFAQRPLQSSHPGSRVPGSFQTNTGQNNPSLNFFSGSRARQFAPQRGTTPMPAPRPVQTAPAAKPFSNVQQTSSLSPYLALDNLETSESLPNYFLFVRPQLNQRSMNRVQQAQYMRLQQQLRTTQAGGAVSTPSGGIPTTGHSGQFMNSGGYYPGLR